MDSIRRTVFLSLAVLLLSCLAVNSQDKRNPEKPLFRVGVDNVFLRVSVTDSRDRCVTGLTRDDFKIYEDKVRQEISTFLQEPSPVSIGFLLDASGSMKENNNIHSARSALRSFMADVTPGDEYFLVAFNQEAELIKDFTDDPGAMLSAGALIRPKGRTALWDALYRGLDTMREARNEKKALILITDGEDNSSRYTSREVREFAKESDVQVYAIGEPGDLGYGPVQIREVAYVTGGRAFFPEGGLSSLEYYISLIHDELRSQYVIGYVPTSTEHDGKWRKIKVQLYQPKGMPKLAVRTREGYYSAKK